MNVATLPRQAARRIAVALDPGARGWRVVVISPGGLLAPGFTPSQPHRDPPDAWASARTLARSTGLPLDPERWLITEAGDQPPEPGRAA